MRSAIRDDNRPLLRLLLRAKGLTGIPDARKQGAARRGRLRRALRRHALRGVRLPVGSRRGRPSSAPARRVAAARAHPGHRLPAVQLQGRAAQRVDPGVRRRGRTPARRRRRPRPLPAVPTLILSGGFDLRTPLEDAAGVAARIPGAQLVAVPFTGHSVVTSDLSDCAKNAMAAFFAGQPAAQCPTVKQVIAPSPIAADAPGQAARAHDGAQDGRRRDGHRARRRACSSWATRSPPGARRRSAPRSAACAPGTRPRPRAATTCAASSSSPASSVNGFVPTQPRHRDADHQRPPAPARQADLPPQRHASPGRLGGRKVVRAPAARAAQRGDAAAARRSCPRYRRLLQLG